MPQMNCQKGHITILNDISEAYRGCPQCNQEAQERHAYNEAFAELIAEKIAQKLHNL